MRIKDFQQQILSQIGIEDLMKALITYERNQEQATAQMVYILGSATLSNAYEANAHLLFTMLLDQAKIPSSLLDLLRLNTALGNAVSASTWEYFYQYTFTGRIETTFDILNSTLDASANPMFGIVAENVIIDILSNPLNMLMGFIDHVAVLWQRQQAMGARTYFLTTSHSELFIFIEARVAEYYGAEHSTDAGIPPVANQVFMGYRFIGAINIPPFNDAFLGITRRAAIHQASSTL